MSKVKVGDIVECVVTGVQSYGAFVLIDDRINGLIHISEISKGYVRNIEDFVRVGDTVFVKILELDEEELRAADEDETAKLEYPSILLKKIEDLELSVRSMNCLRGENITYLGDLVHKTESEMLKTPNFGRKSLNEIKAILSNLGLSLGLSFPAWPPENLEELAKNYEKF